MKYRSTRPDPRLLVAAFAAIYLIWGSSYLGIVYAIKTMPPFLMAGFRYITAGLLMLVWLAKPLLDGSIKPPTRRQFLNCGLIGILLMLFGNGFVVWAELRIATGVAALLVATEPIWVVLLTWKATRRRPNLLVALGIALGVVGTVTLVGPSGFSGRASVDLLGVLAVVIATIGWANGSVFAARADLPASPVFSTSLQMLCGGATLVIVGTTLGEWSGFNLAKVSMESWLAFAFLVSFASIVAFTAYTWLTRNASPGMVATYAYVNPIIAVLLGWAINHEPLSNRTFIAAALLVTAVVLMTRGDHAPRKLADSADRSFTDISHAPTA